jgi:hypothetical protein
MLGSVESTKKPASSGKSVVVSEYSVPGSITPGARSFTSDEHHGDLDRSRQGVMFNSIELDTIHPPKPVLASDRVLFAETAVPSPDVTIDQQCNTNDEESQPDGSTRPNALPSGLRRFCFRWLTAYRMLFAMTLAINLVVLSLLIAFDVRSVGVLDAVAANLTVSVLVRQEDLINLSFSLVAKIPSTLPLAFRKIIADSHHYGGVHIGCAVSALCWYMLFVILSTLQCARRVAEGSISGWHWADLATTYAFLAFILVICVSAIPRLREKFHNSFERTHRFGGWSAILVIWINSGIHTVVDPAHTALYYSPSIWMLAVTTFLIVLPWLRIRRIPIVASAVSNREVKLTFPYANMAYTSTARFSLSPLTEWHAFATIPAPDGTCASVIVSAAGDWTKSLAASPPSHIWIRAPAAMNFLAFAPVFNSLLLVATGAGIGPLLSLLASPAIATMKTAAKVVKVMWCVYGADAAHWAFVQDAIRAVDPAPSIFDSKLGRVDVVFEAAYAARVNGVEAVMVVSNKKVTDQVVRKVKGGGRAAYGAVFDS